MHTLRKHSRNVFLLIIGLQLATSFGAIALLVRMGPAIAKVAEENVESVSAIEDMLAALAGAGPLDDQHRTAFLAAYQRAEDNVTEEEELPLLNEIGSAAEGAFSGDPPATRRVVQRLQELAEVNRSALRRADREAQRLAEAGAWAAVALSMVAFVFARYVANRVDRQFVMPVLEISDTINAARQGDGFRRCAGLSQSPEIQNIVDGVNQLLDQAEGRPEP